MDELIRARELREFFLSMPDSEPSRWLALAGSLGLVAVVLVLVRRRALREEYTPIWMLVALGLVAVTWDLDVLRWISRAIGAWTLSSTLFFLGEVFLVAICLNFAVRLSRTSVQLKKLGQEVALLRARIEAAEAPAGEGGVGT